jgi:hypothetical protein
MSPFLKCNWEHCWRAIQWATWARKTCFCWGMENPSISEYLTTAIAKPCLPSVRSYRHWDLKELRVWSGSQREGKHAWIQRSAKLHGQLISVRGMEKRGNRSSNPGLSGLLEDMWSQLPLTMNRSWTPDGRWNTCVQCFLSWNLCNHSKYFVCSFFWSVLLHKSTRTRKQGRR